MGAHNIKNIDLTTFPFKLINFSVCDLVDAGEKLIVTTTEGDVVELHLSSKAETTSSNIMGNKQIVFFFKNITKHIIHRAKESIISQN